MAVTWYDVVGGTHGSTVIASNYDPDVSGVIVATGNMVIQTSGGAFGSTKHLLETGSTTSDSTVAWLDFSAGETATVAREFSLDALPSVETRILALASSATRQISLAVTTSGALRIRDSANTARWTTSPAATSSPALTLSTRYHVSLTATRNATTGTFKVTVSNYDTGAELFTTGVQTAVNTGASAFNRVYWGPKTSSANATVTLESAGLAVDPVGTEVIAPRHTSAGNPTLVLSQPAPNVVDLRESSTGDSSSPTFPSPLHVSGPTLSYASLNPGLWLFTQSTPSSVYTFTVSQADAKTDTENATIAAVASGETVNIAAPLRPLGTPPNTTWG